MNLISIGFIMLFNVKRDEIYMLFFKFENLIYSYDSTKSFEKFN